MEVEVHPLTNDPNSAWEMISKKQSVKKLKIKPLKPEIPKNKVRVVCMSDTHSLLHKIKFDIPHGDIYINAGDFTSVGKREEVIKFNEWIGLLPHRHKLVIAGNHELTFDRACSHPLQTLHCQRTEGGTSTSTYPGTSEQNDFHQYLTNCTYLQDQLIELYGLKIYGTPWQPEFGQWAFNLKRGQQILDKWNEIPADIDILISHSPPLGHGDMCRSGRRAGCAELLATVQRRVRPKYHIFGHIHEGYGVTSDGKIIFINASTCNLQYSPINPPVVFDIDLPKGLVKGE